MTGKDVGYYALAAVLVVATVPLYRYIIERGHASDTLPAERVVTVVRPEYVPAPQPERIPLLAGERCVGGVIVAVSGNVYTQAVDADGHAARCEGQFRVTAH